MWCQTPHRGNGAALKPNLSTETHLPAVSAAWLGQGHRVGWQQGWSAALRLESTDLSQALLPTSLRITSSTCWFSSLPVIGQYTKWFGAESCCLVSDFCSTTWPGTADPTGCYGTVSKFKPSGASELGAFSSDHWDQGESGTFA